MNPQAKKKGGMMFGGGKPNKMANFFAKKGEKKLAAHEYREAAGKEKDTKAIAKKEERALKGAPADLKAYESKEHKAMGYKKGGKVKPNFAKKFGAKMKPPGSPKPPGAKMDMPDIGPMPPKDGASMLPAMPPSMGGMGGGMKPPGMNKGGMACGGSMKKYAEGGAVKKPYKLTAGDRNEIAGGDQEMKMREDAAAKNRMRGPGRGPLSRNGMKNNPFGYAKGGMVKGDGIAMRGKTKCKVC
jgi:hypothetical protein